MTKQSKPFISYNEYHAKNDKAPKYKASEFVIDGVPGCFEVVVFEKMGSNGTPYLILKLEDAVSAELAAHEARMERLRNKSESI